MASSSVRSQMFLVSMFISENGRFASATSASRWASTSGYSISVATPL